ncbi:2TM domain-containing protein [Ideonella azotifigens]|uniref:2TM domain-containing protein n=1 Tax=Ideonella azotifigens TaxID=513160 RepID=A0ABP3VV52_9BURK|nr:2TM domain-containing protein [Ideonella azotifigens]MCD2340309.1 2TM domain-containing protein [Ideonella azotifigens]
MRRHGSPSERRRGFGVHALVFVLGMALLAGINLLWTGPPYWVLWVLPGWGIGLVAHGWAVLGAGARNEFGSARR